MKKTHHPLIACILMAMLSVACKKDTIETTPLASLRIINTVTGGSAVKLGSVSTIVSNNTHTNFSILPKSNIYVYPTGDSLTPYYVAGKEIVIGERESYSLFLGGTPGSIAALLVKENISIRTDSTAGIRFINLSPNSPPVNVTLSTTPSVSEFLNIGYKDITDFKSYPATSANTSYTFQIRNATTDKIIASITMSGTSITNYVPRFKNVTLVLRGMPTGTPAAGITRVNHY